MSILIVDDNARMRQMIRSIVTPVDADIREAADGDEAVRLLEAHRPSWVLMDVHMPHEDGLSITRRIRLASPETRVVIVTDHDDAWMRDMAIEAGAVELIPKDALSRLRDVLAETTQLHNRGA